MNTKPIIFNGDMVRTLLDGRKTQTRRVMKPVKDHMIGCELSGCEVAGEVNNGDYRNSPFGEPGDLIWVREAFAYLPTSAYRGSRGIEQRLSPGCPDMAAVFRAGFDRSGKQPWKPSIHMPRWASRMTLRITDVRVERVQEISEADAIAEGVSDCYEITDPATGEINRDACEAFEELWDSINGPRGYGWDANPWVWALTFEVIQANVDDVAGRAA